MNGCLVLGWVCGDGRKKERSQVKGTELHSVVIKCSEADGIDGCIYL